MRLLLCIVLCLLPISAGADILVGYAPEVSGGASACPAGTYQFAWNGDSASGIRVGCIGSTEQAGGDLGTVEISATYGESSTVGLQVTGANESLVFCTKQGDIPSSGACANEGVEVADDALGTIWMRIYNAAVSAATPIFEVAYNSGNIFYCYHSGTGRISCEYKGNASSATATTTANTTDGKLQNAEWAWIKYTWDQASSKHKVCIDHGTISCTEVTTAGLTAWQTAGPTYRNPIEFHLGEDVSGVAAGNTLQYDNVYFYSDYDHAAPY